MASSERIFGLLDTPVTITSADGGQRTADGGSLRADGRRPTADGGVTRDDASGPSADSRQPSAGHIRFDHVWFAYNGEDYVLKDVSFEVTPGQRLAVVGATGAGKSTIINLLMRFYDVSRGRILVDGVDIREMELGKLRALFSLVLQDVQLFSGTIASNIRLGSEISDADVRQAADAVHAGAFVDRLPEGLASPVGERGASLSVGQKQLLSFARALAFNPQVLILDEATSSVDTETELLIRDALTVLMAGRTTIAVAHRLSTIQDMDRILVFHKGELRESGAHQELLARRGIYYRLYQLQYKEQESATAPAIAGLRLATGDLQPARRP
jgi:ATP-binding cassette subfamily B protein